MAFQRGTSSASDGCHDMLVSLQAFLTSQHISAAVINAAGTGYVAGDNLTITHAGAYHDCTIEVLTVDGGGGILTFAIRDHGAFANRVATVGIGTDDGSGYVANDIVRLTSGTFTEFCKVRIDTVGGSGEATAVSIFETGGAYTSAPDATDGATNSDIGTGSGTGLEIDTTMTGLIGTTGISATGGTGSGATFDLTLTATGWSMVESKQNQNNYEDTGVAVSSRTDEKELILQGTVAGGDDPYVGIRSYSTETSNGSGVFRYGWMFAGMDNFNNSLGFDFQPNIGPGDNGANNPSDNDNPCLLMYNDDQDWWFQADGRQFKVVVKAVGASSTDYTSAYAGLLNPFGTQTEIPYPMYLAATTTSYIRPPSSGGNFVTGLSELRADLTTTCPHFYRQHSDAVWQQIQNVSGSTGGSALSQRGMLPMFVSARSTNNSTSEFTLSADGAFEIHLEGNAGISEEAGGVSTGILMPTIGDNEIVLFPLTIVTTPNSSGDNDTETQIRGELSGAFWHGNTDGTGAALTAEDTIDSDGFRHYNFPNVHRTERYSYFCIRAE